MTILEVYKLPFKLAYGKIFTSESNMALDFIVRMSVKEQQRVVDVLNGISSEHTTKNLTNVEGEISANNIPVLLIRGWGYLTGIGGLHLPSDEAARIQDGFAEWVILRLQGKV